MSAKQMASDNMDTTVSVLTNPATTVVSGSAGVAVWLTQNAPPIIAGLTILVLLAQVVSWGYRFYKWCKKEKGA